MTNQHLTSEIEALIKKHYGGYAANGNPGATFEQTTKASWKNCSANGESYQTREELIAALEHGLHKLIPDLKWEILEIIPSGDKVVVRGQGSGTPIGPFMGVPASGKSFKIMSIDIHTLEDGKITYTHHLEDWAMAMGQLADN
ncbi:MAG: ester cyclase [Lewinellaceae bacterium]|nr:ester cyclase [Lewinellaceae bacterium]